MGMVKQHVTEEDTELRVIDPETRATIDGVSYVLVAKDVVFVICEGDLDYAIPEIERVKISSPDYVESTLNGTVVYKTTSPVQIEENKGTWELVSDKK